MKAELRIGNKVNVIDNDGGIDTVIEIQRDYCICQEYGSVDWSMVEPIPLSPEWLESFGFRSDLKDWYWLPTGKNSYIAANPHGFYLSVTDPDDETFKTDKDEFADKLEIEYVHQLQNLYFALTGKELTLKP